MTSYPRRRAAAPAPFARTAALALTLAAGAALPLALTVPAPVAVAQQGGVSWTGEMGITETVAQIMRRPTAPIPMPLEADEHDEYPDRVGLPQDPGSPWVSQWPPAPTGFRPLPVPVYPRVGNPDADNPQTITLNFQGVGSGESGWFPPDTQMAVGPTQIAGLANGRLKFFTKTGAAGPLNTTADSFFASVRGANNVIDTMVRYDQTAGRWVVMGITNAGSNNRVCIAVSSGATVTSASSFTFFFFQQDQVAPVGNSGQFADYPSLGIDAAAIYIGCNMFAGPFVGTTGWVVQKSSVLGAGPIVATAFRNIATNAVNSGPYSPRGVDNDAPSVTEGYFIGTAVGMTGRLMLRRIFNPGSGAPTISSNVVITVPATSAPFNFLPSGSSTAIEVGDDRLYAAAIRRNRLTGASSLVTAHTIQVNTSGVASSSGGRNAARWYQLGNITATPTVLQSGTLFDPASPPVHYFYATAAMSGQGHIAVAASTASTSTFIGAGTAGRLSGDAPGTTQAASSIVTGAGSYTNVFSGRNRWGDYSATYVDPADDQTIWTAQEYAGGGNSWSIRLAKLMAPPPVTPTGADPSSIGQGATNVEVVVTGTSSAGTAFYDTEPGLSRLQASVSGTGVSVINAVYTSPTQVTLTLNVDPAAAAGPRTLTITNPDGQSAASAPGLITINTSNPVCPAITLQPTGGQYCAGDPLSLTTSATGNPAPTYQWYRDTTLLIGATGATYSVFPAGTGDSGSYTCVASNSCGTATTNPAVVSVGATPAITTQPASQTVQVGTPVDFTVATSAAGATFQWRKDLFDIAGATAATYHIAAAAPADAGSYDCLVSTICGGIYTDSATLTVNQGSACYANCDSSTTPPVANVADFTCFLQKFAASDPYANCDGSTTPPAINVADFTCFLQKFAAGCSAP